MTFETDELRRLFMFLQSAQAELREAERIFRSILTVETTSVRFRLPRQRRQK